MWKKLVAALAITMILSFATSMKISQRLIASEDDAMEWNSDDGVDIGLLKS